MNFNNCVLQIVLVLTLFKCCLNLSDRMIEADVDIFRQLKGPAWTAEIEQEYIEWRKWTSRMLIESHDVQPITDKQWAWWNSLAHRRTTHNPSPQYDAVGVTYIENPIYLREEYRQLSQEEQFRYRNTVRTMMNTVVDANDPDTSQYDLFVRMHFPTASPAAHRGPAFLPWHREYLFRFESALQQIDANLTLPYWDSTLDQALPVSQDSILWSENHLGNSNGNVSTGIFAWHEIVPECHILGSSLTRDCGVGSLKLMTREEIKTAITHDYYANLSCGIHDCFFESVHGGPHSFHMGYPFDSGHMGHVLCSPSDPIFWMHHAFVDLMWEEFRMEYQITDVELEYPTSDYFTEEYPENHDWWQPMGPFAGYINAHGMSSHYTNYYYTYSTRPSLVSCAVDSDCGGDLMWCDVATNYCISKIRQGGSCKGLQDNACAPECLNGASVACVEDICQCDYLQLEKNQDKFN